MEILNWFKRLLTPKVAATEHRVDSPHHWSQSSSRDGLDDTYSSAEDNQCSSDSASSSDCSSDSGGDGGGSGSD